MFKNLLFILISVLTTNTLSAQRIGWTVIDSLKVTPWTTDDIKDYESVYHFGESEGESDFVLIITGNTIYAQIITGHWNESSTAWVREHINLQNVKIEDSKFFSDSYNGEFVIYSGGEKPVFGLKIYNPWGNELYDNQYEIGITSYPIKTHYDLGMYTQASTRLLKKIELDKFKTSELQLMRNEIYARYGYTFIKGGKMDTYFSKFDWYKPRHKSVEKMLTELEKQNIKTIKKVEAK